MVSRQSVMTASYRLPPGSRSSLTAQGSRRERGADLLRRVQCLARAPFIAPLCSKNALPRGPFRFAHRADLAAGAAAAEELFASVGFQPRHADAGREREALQGLA